MKANTKIRGRIISVILITLLAAGFYFYSARNNRVGETVKSAPPVARESSGAAQNKGPDTYQGDGTINLVRPPFLDE